MPRGRRLPSNWSEKEKRQYEHIKASGKKSGRSLRRAKQIAAATVNRSRGKKNPRRRRSQVREAN